MNEKLLPKQSFDQLITQANKIVQLLKSINDEAQSTNYADFDAVKDALKEKQREFMDEGEQLKNVLPQLDKQAVGMDQKRKLKQVKDAFQKEINRNKSIMEEIINEGYEIRRQSLIKQSVDRPTTRSFDRDQQQQLEMSIPQEQLEIENRLIQERQQEINEIQRDAKVLHKIVGDLAVETDKQDVQLDVIGTNQTGTKTNLVAANQELSQAQNEQKATQKKCICLVVVVVVGVIALGVTLYFTLS